MLGRASKAFISTPFWSIISPAVFAVLGYMYVQKAYGWIGVDPAVYSSHWSEPVTLALVFLGIGFLLARVRLQRVALSLRDEEWLAEVDAAPRSHFGLCILRIQPVLFPPTRFKISKNGVLVIGWHYIATLPYSQIKGVTNRGKGNLSGSGFYLTRSFEDLVEIQLRFEHDPVFIGPDKHDYFLEKAQFLNASHRNT